MDPIETFIGCFTAFVIRKTMLADFVVRWCSKNDYLMVYLRGSDRLSFYTTTRVWPEVSLLTTQQNITAFAKEEGMAVLGELEAKCFAESVVKG